MAEDRFTTFIGRLKENMTRNGSDKLHLWKPNEYDRDHGVWTYPNDTKSSRKRKMPKKEYNPGRRRYEKAVMPDMDILHLFPNKDNTIFSKCSTSKLGKVVRCAAMKTRPSRNDKPVDDEEMNDGSMKLMSRCHNCADGRCIIMYDIKSVGKSVQTVTHDEKKNESTFVLGINGKSSVKRTKVRFAMVCKWHYNMIFNKDVNTRVSDGVIFTSHHTLPLSIDTVSGNDGIEYARSNSNRSWFYEEKNPNRGSDNYIDNMDGVTQCIRDNWLYAYYITSKSWGDNDVWEWNNGIMDESAYKGTLRSMVNLQLIMFYDTVIKEATDQLYIAKNVNGSTNTSWVRDRADSNIELLNMFIKDLQKRRQDQVMRIKSRDARFGDFYPLVRYLQLKGADNDNMDRDGGGDDDLEMSNDNRDVSDNDRDRDGGGGGGGDDLEMSNDNRFEMSDDEKDKDDSENKVEENQAEQDQDQRQEMFEDPLDSLKHVVVPKMSGKLEHEQEMSEDKYDEGDEGEDSDEDDEDDEDEDSDEDGDQPMKQATSLQSNFGDFEALSTYDNRLGAGNPRPNKHAIEINGDEMVNEELQVYNSLIDVKIRGRRKSNDMYAYQMFEMNYNDDDKPTKVDSMQSPYAFSHEYTVFQHTPTSNNRVAIVFIGGANQEMSQLETWDTWRGGFLRDAIKFYYIDKQGNDLENVFTYKSTGGRLIYKDDHDVKVGNAEVITHAQINNTIKCDVLSLQLMNRACHWLCKKGSNESFELVMFMPHDSVPLTFAYNIASMPPHSMMHDVSVKRDRTKFETYCVLSRRHAAVFASVEPKYLVSSEKAIDDKDPFSDIRENEEFASMALYHLFMTVPYRVGTAPVYSPTGDLETYVDERRQIKLGGVDVTHSPVAYVWTREDEDPDYSARHTFDNLEDVMTLHKNNATDRTSLEFFTQIQTEEQKRNNIVLVDEKLSNNLSGILHMKWKNKVIEDNGNANYYYLGWYVLCGVNVKLDPVHMQIFAGSPSWGEMKTVGFDNNNKKRLFGLNEDDENTWYNKYIATPNKRKSDTYKQSELNKRQRSSNKHQKKR